MGSVSLVNDKSVGKIQVTTVLTMLFVCVCVGGMSETVNAVKLNIAFTAQLHYNC